MLAFCLVMVVACFTEQVNLYLYYLYLFFGIHLRNNDGKMENLYTCTNVTFECTCSALLGVLTLFPLRLKIESGRSATTPED